jgi:outer membrane lipoprotein SlyB
MIIVAATAATIASLAATAHFVGWLPQSSAPVETTAAPLAAASGTAETAAAQAATPPAPSLAPQAQASAPVRKAVATPPSHPTSVRSERPKNLHYASTQPAASPATSNDNGIDVIEARPPQPPVCQDCATIEAVREISAPGEGSGLGAVAGGVIGGLLGKQVGKGNGSTAAAIVGALGGAYAGHEAEKHVRANKQLEVTLRFDDGAVRTMTLESAGRWRAGDRVRLHNGGLQAL